MKKTMVITYVRDGILNERLISLAIGHNGEDANLKIDDVKTYLLLEKLRFPNTLGNMVIDMEEDCLRILENGRDVTSIVTYIPYLN